MVFQFENYTNKITILIINKQNEKYMHNTEQETITWTKCLEDSSRIKNLIPQLQLAGFSEHEIDRILYLNMQRFFKVSTDRRSKM